MATYVNNLRLKEITTGDEDGTWGTSTNTNLELITDGFSYGTKQLSADANETFTMPDGTADDSRSFYLKITSAVSLTATREVTLGPSTVSKVWMIENATTGSQIITIKQGSGATVNVANGSKVMVVTDGAGAGAAVFNANPTEVGGTVTSVGGTGTVNGITLTGTVTSSGNLTLGGTLANVDLTSQITGTLPVANGGTGVTSSTGSGSVVLSTAPTLDGTVTLNQTNAATNTSAAITNTNDDKGTLWNFTQSRSGGAPNANFLFGHGGNSSGDVEVRNTTSSHIKFYVNDTERVRLWSGGALICSSGVTLGTAVDTFDAANTLDDYEEGTFTPEVADASLGGNTATGTFTGIYTKIGRLVIAEISLVNINTTGMTGTNDLYIRNMPFTNSSTSQGIVSFNFVTNSGAVTAYMTNSTSAFRLGEQLNNAARDMITVDQISSGTSDILVTLIYFD
jgi:hypothetical protein